MGSAKIAKTTDKQCSTSRVVDPEWFFSDPDPTFREVSALTPDPDPV